MKIAIFNTQTFSRANGEFADRAIRDAREKMYIKLGEFVNLESLNNVLDVGVTADREMQSSNFFENRYPRSDRITALSDQDASFLENVYSGLKFTRGNALDMPFEDDAFDLVFSNAVIEHAGSRENQTRFISECFRVAKKYIFITTPNRLHPIEFHTVLPFIHLLPKNLHRKILRLLKMDFFASEENLNLLSKKELLNLAKIAIANINSSDSYFAPPPPPPKPQKHKKIFVFFLPFFFTPS
ncbi:MAG: class I SAM-dependent methyltransferase, partial [Helicobacteraceae bacterium]|nr:class I SAM-dependent methyltransferase [Helicobacteraceae bacterium]